MPTICTWWIILCRLIETVATILGSAYICMQIICDCISEPTTFFQFSKKFLPIKVVIWVCMNCLDCLDLAGLCIFFSWWRNPSMWIEVVIGILGTSYSCRFCRLFFWFHIWIRMHRALFCFKNVNCHDGVLFWKLAGACSLCLVRFVQMNLHCQCSLFRLQRWLTFLVVAVLLSLLMVVGTFQNYRVLSPVYKSTPTMTNITYVA